MRSFRAPKYQRAQGKPDASRTRSLVRKVLVKRTSFIHQQVDRPRLSLHDGLTAYSVISSVGHFATVAATNALRLVTRLSDFDFLQLRHKP